MKRVTTTRKRRDLLKAGLLIPACGLVKLPLQKAFAPPLAPERVSPELQEQLLRLSEDEQECLAILLKVFATSKSPIAFEPWVVEGCIAGAKQKQSLINYLAQESAKHKAYCRQREKLTGQAKVKSIAEEIEWNVRHYNADYQKEILLFSVGKLPCLSRPKTTTDSYALETLDTCFEGCNKRLRQQAVDYYLANIWPKEKAEADEEAVSEAAYDELLEVVDGKTPEQIWGIAAHLRGFLAATQN